jgi:hypothetical protein
MEELKGKILGCVCKPMNNCHGDVIIELINYYHPDNTPLHLKPPHKVINGFNAWIDRVNSRYAHQYSNCQDLFVQLVDGKENGLQYQLMSGRKLMYWNTSEDAIKKTIDFLNYDRP